MLTANFFTLKVFLLDCFFHLFIAKYAHDERHSLKINKVYAVFNVVVNYKKNHLKQTVRGDAIFD